MNGILLVNKPQGFTSFDVIAKLRGILKMKRLGHSGTLDPMATGVLPVLVGNATKACDILPCEDKAYRAGFVLGKTSDTQDISGTILTECDTSVSETQIRNCLPSFIGEIQQIPPMYSAVKVGGRKLYDLARKGVEVERSARTIQVDDLQLLSYSEETREGVLEIHCKKGVYVRTILHDIGEKLGVGAVMTSLVRSCSNGFLLEQCYTLEQIQNMAQEGRAEELLIPIESAFISLPEILLTERQSRLYQNGFQLPMEEFSSVTEGISYRIYGVSGFFGLGRFEEGVLRVQKNLTARE